MLKDKRTTKLFFDKLHKGAVCICMGVTLYGCATLGIRGYQYLFIQRPERAAAKALKELKEIDSELLVDKA